ncbi:hypothetical protein EJD97_019034 [Solanum chilense]|uniref:Uncharacterized protein n=1 Tax=Solanum chilense TaxID=4083 RepID=A0A6N2AZU7_SOLCI|nr:hypothetical protein EJD97_019034 [Solanum chilense]
MGFRIGDSTNVVIACIVSSYGQMEIEMKKLWPSSLLLLQRNDISKVEKPVREYALHDWICQAEIVSCSKVLVDIIHFFSFGNLSGLSAVPQDKTASHATYRFRICLRDLCYFFLSLVSEHLKKYA